MGGRGEGLGNRLPRQDDTCIGLQRNVSRGTYSSSPTQSFMFLSKDWDVENETEQNYRVVPSARHSHMRIDFVCADLNRLRKQRI